MNDKWISFKAGKCWGLKTVETISVYDKKYLPASVLSRLLEEKQNRVAWIGRFWIKTINGIGQIKSFFKIEHLEDVIAKLKPDWDSDDIQECVDDVLRFREQSPGKRAASPEQDEESNKKHMPAWAHEFVERIESSISQRALFHYMATPKFKEECAKVVKQRGDAIEGRLKEELREKVEAELRQELEEEVREQVRSQEIESRHMEFLEQVAQKTAQKAPLTVATDDEILKLAGFLK